MPTNFNPIWVSNPGDTIRDLLRMKGLESESLPGLLNISEDKTSSILTGEMDIDLGVAQTLSDTLGFSSDFWVTRFQQYHDDLARLEQKLNDDWLRSIPTSDMIKLGWIRKSNDLFKDCLEFFNCADISEWQERYVTSLAQFTFRSSGKYASKIPSTVAWLRQGEIQASKQKCNSWSPEGILNRVNEMKSLSRVRTPQNFLPKLSKICSDNGVALVVVQSPTGCSMSGAAKVLDENKRMILMSFRYLSDDQFWFTFFHEMGHLVLHHRSEIFIDDRLEDSTMDETEANNFAGEILIPFEERQKLKSLRGNKRAIISLASELNISPGILIGQMQYYGLIQPAYLNGYKRWYSWDQIKEATSQA